MLTAEQLAERAGVSLRAIGSMERGKSAPRFGTMQRVAKALGVDPVEIDEFRAVITGETGE